MNQKQNPDQTWGLLGLAGEIKNQTRVFRLIYGNKIMTFAMPPFYFIAVINKEHVHMTSFTINFL